MLLPSDPKHPRPLWLGQMFVHGLNLSDDGGRAYAADPIGRALSILDMSQRPKAIMLNLEYPIGMIERGGTA